MTSATRAGCCCDHAETVSIAVPTIMQSQRSNLASSLASAPIDCLEECMKGQRAKNAGRQRLLEKAAGRGSPHHHICLPLR